MIYLDIESLGQDEYWEETYISPDYYVSNYGRIYSKRNEKILKQSLNGKGYLRVSIFLKDENGKSKQTTSKVHKLVAGTFLKKIKDTYVVDHIDRDKQNNKLSNLRYVSISDNNKNRDVYGSILITKYETYRVRYIKRSGEIISSTFKTEEEAKLFLDDLRVIFKR